MTSNSIEFSFKLQDRVLIKEIGRPGLIEAMLVDSLGQQYRIAYWNDGNRKAEWLYGWELELRGGT